MYLPLHLCEEILKKSNDYDLLILYKGSELIKKPKDNVEIDWKTVSIIQLQYYINYNCIPCDKRKLFVKAVRYNRLDLFVFLVNFIPFDLRIPSIMMEACSEGRFEIIQYMITELRGFFIRDIDYWLSFSNEHMDVFEMLLNCCPLGKCKTSDDISEYAAQTSFSSVKLLKKYKVPFSDKMLDGAIECEQIQIIRYLCEGCGMVPTIDSMYAAVYANNIEIVKYIVRLGVKCTREIIESSDSMEIYNYLSKMYLSS